MEFTERTDLASERLGGAVVWATDDFFAPKEAMIQSGRGEYVPGKYTERGKWMDGWESRRRRAGSHDAAIVRLGLRGSIRGFDVDTNHFVGNAPKSVRIEARCEEGYVSTAAIVADEGGWVEILAMSEVKPGSQNLFVLEDDRPWTHVRLHIHPDGGVARFRVYGDVRPDWARLLDEQDVVDLAAVEHGGQVLVASDNFFADRRNLILPGPSLFMGDGWETKRRRGPGHDWILVRLGLPCLPVRCVIDTWHFKGNFPESCLIETLFVPEAGEDLEALERAPVHELLARTPLEAHTRHEVRWSSTLPASHVRLRIFPDGGVARLRFFGRPL